MDKNFNFKDHDFAVISDKHHDINIIMIADDPLQLRYFDYVYGCDITTEQIQEYIDDCLRICDHCGQVFSINNKHEYIIGQESGTVYCKDCVINTVYDSKLDEEM